MIRCVKFTVYVNINNLYRMYDLKKKKIYVSYLVRILYAIWHLTLLYYIFLLELITKKLFIHAGAVLCRKRLVCRLRLFFILAYFPNVKKKRI
jgi:hypothetical protein